jgi:2',3'-cyclic-nucleotide 2'-phosphodiesterase (5'-nucleotidase family)
MGKKTGEITLVFMNDTHNAIYPYEDTAEKTFYGGAARWASVIKDIRREKGELLFLHSGDMLSGTDPDYLVFGEPNWERFPAYGYRGSMDIELFKLLGLDVMTFGNHEFDYGLWWNNHIFKNALFDRLCANLLLNGNEQFFGAYFKPYEIYKKRDFRIGVIGLTTSDYMQSSMIKIKDPAATLLPLVKKLKNKCDITVVLSHLGFALDKQLAEAVPGIDVIIGGHTHSLVKNGFLVNDTIIAQAGAFGRYVGRLDLEYEKGARKNYAYSLIPVDKSVPEDPEIKAWLDKGLYPVVLEKSLRSGEKGENSLEDYILAEIHKRFDSSGLILNTGRYKGELNAGKVSAKDYFTLF